MGEKYWLHIFSNSALLANRNGLILFKSEEQRKAVGYLWNV